MSEVAEVARWLCPRVCGGCVCGGCAEDVRRVCVRRLCRVCAEVSVDGEMSTCPMCGGCVVAVSEHVSEDVAELVQRVAEGCGGCVEHVLRVCKGCAEGVLL